MKTGIVIITYNNPDLILLQRECIEKFCQDDYEIVVFDNSNQQYAIDAIAYYCRDVRYFKVDAKEGDSSRSHAFAANASYKKMKNDYDLFFYLDHDCFPIRPFSVKEILGGKMMAGIAQNKSKNYIWPGCFMFKRVPKVDFSTNSHFRLDTGGNLYKLLEKHGEDNCVWFHEAHHKNPYFDKSQYTNYSIIHETFLHFIAGSNWPQNDHHTERMNSLINIVREHL